MDFFSRQDIEQLINLKSLTDTIEEVLLNKSGSKYFTPDRQQHQFHSATHLIMPSYGPKYSGLKTVSINPDNEKNDLPVIQGTMQLSDSTTGQPLALFDGAAITGYRTGAVGALGIRHLAPKEATTLGIVGSGNQGFHQVLAADAERSFKQILLFDINRAKSTNLAKELKTKIRCKNIIAVDSIEELTAGSEVIITATSSSRPVLPEDKPILFGKTIIAMGSFSPNMKELPIELFEHLKKCVIDTRAALKESGDMIEPIINNRFHIDDIIEMSYFLKSENSIDLGETRLFKSVGSALFDLAIAAKLFELNKD